MISLLLRTSITNELHDENVRMRWVNTKKVFPGCNRIDWCVPDHTRPDKNGFYILVSRVKPLTPLVLQFRFGDKQLQFLVVSPQNRTALLPQGSKVVCPQNGAAVLKVLVSPPKNNTAGIKGTSHTNARPSEIEVSQIEVFNHGMLEQTGLASVIYLNRCNAWTERMGEGHKINIVRELI